MQGSAPVLSRKPTSPPAPPAAYVCNVQSVPLPAAGENGGVQKGDGSIPLSKVRTQIKKKNNINNNIIIIIHKRNRQQDTEHKKGSGGQAGGAQDRGWAVRLSTLHQGG